ncbi:MAG: polysulfide reductase NrfD [Deltaproteobacteria bacterium]|nr:polysulfide reductase NrfD [Deltaproteobacteria bacterium]
MAGLTLREAADRVLGTTSRPGPVHVVLVGLCASLVTAAGIAWLSPGAGDLGSAAGSTPAGRALLDASFAFWAGIAQAGLLLAAAGRLSRAGRGTAGSRVPEAVAVFAALTAALFPLVRFGRPGQAWRLLPFPDAQGLWPNFASPLVWQAVAIPTSLVLGALLLHCGALPDLAALRDRAAGRRRKLYALPALGWRGSARQWEARRQAGRALAVAAVVAAVVALLAVSRDLGASAGSGGQGASFAVGFVAGALQSGLALVLVLLVALRRFLGVGEPFESRLLERPARAVFLLGLLVGLAGGSEYLFARVADDRSALDLLVYRATGEWAAAWWVALGCKVVLPLALFAGRVRRSPGALFAIASLVVVGTWLERFVFAVTSLSRGPLPHAWSPAAAPSWADAALALGSAGWFFLWFLLLLLVLPWLPIVAVRSAAAVPAGGGGEVRG